MRADTVQNPTSRERRKSLAHGVSLGQADKIIEAPEGRKNRDVEHEARRILSPLRASIVLPVRYPR